MEIGEALKYLEVPFLYISRGKPDFFEQCLCDTYYLLIARRVLSSFAISQIYYPNGIQVFDALTGPLDPSLIECRGSVVPTM